MFLLVLGAGVSLGWVTYEARKQGNAVAALEKLGCRIDYSDAKSPTTLLEHLRRLAVEEQWRDVICVVADESRLTDIEMA